MCESRVVIEKKEGVEEVMSEAAKVVVDGKDIVVTDILGNSKTLKNSSIKDVDFLNHIVKVVKNED